ncbi:hypothetical protein CDD80_4412 [Ophiocordyceps camponoti-rufipedis]|uniref:Uncharacterized protein n=1 Tax=Ophiocordyceps camponoti-rufipedis TaxID=2004952 RepID=A0A2C5YZZ0_9HYPO|nr:hypothetical protein CDD80_4412 [Ophiocordyceps camponoti-rufipedis]
MKFSQVFLNAIFASSAAAVALSPGQQGAGQDLAQRSVGIEGAVADPSIAARNVDSELDKRAPKKGKKGKKGGKKGKKGKKGAKAAKAATANAATAKDNGNGN